MSSDELTEVIPTGQQAVIPVDTWVQGCVARWWASPTTLPDLGRRYTRAEQAEYEARLTQMAEAIGAELERAAPTAEVQRALKKRFSAEAMGLAQAALGFKADDLAAMHVDDFSDVLVEFARQARRFDEQLTADDIFQAGRNVMSAGLLQLLLGRPIELTPAIFAYSLLYPYSDNVLDDPNLNPAALRAFNQRFRQRLEGQPVAPANGREAAIDRLVTMVERQYDRDCHPRVYASLLAIHAAQTRSLELMQGGAAPYELDLLGLTFDKGGASVLADAYLAAGDLSAAEATFAFELGAFLQFVDDLEDVETDMAAGRQSVFALAARHWRLDALTSRTLNFGVQVLGPRGLPAADARRAFLQRGLSQAVIHSAGRARRWHSRGYVSELEAHTPFRFAFVENLTRRMSRKAARAWPRLQAELDKPAREGDGEHVSNQRLGQSKIRAMPF